MSFRRGKLEVLLDFLSSLEYECRVTRVMHDANLSYLRFMRFANLSLMRNLIRMAYDERGTKYYCLTPKGKKVVACYRNIKKLTV